MKELTIEDGVRKAFERYRDVIAAMGIKPENLADTDPISLAHARWMADTALKSMKKREWSFDKVNRWLGFVQCILIRHKLTTVNQERDITRPWLSKG